MKSDREVTKALVLREVTKAVALFSRHFWPPRLAGAELGKISLYFCHRIPLTTLLQCLVHSTLCTKIVVENHRLSEESSQKRQGVFNVLCIFCINDDTLTSSATE